MKFAIGVWKEGHSRVDAVVVPDGDVAIKVDNIIVGWLTAEGSFKRGCLKKDCPDGITKESEGDFIAIEDQQPPPLHG